MLLVFIYISSFITSFERVLNAFLNVKTLSMMMSSWLGSHRLASRFIFVRAPYTAGYDLLDVCVNGPAERLNLTEARAAVCWHTTRFRST